jgi:recombination protein RecT
MAAPATALTIVDRVEKSPAVLAIDANSQALVDLLPDAAAVSRFRRVVIQALMKTPELLDCTPESVVRSVFEAAAMGLEPTGASGGAHLVPYNVKVSKNPDRYEKQAQLIPDYRGVIRLVTKPPSEVVSLEARVVKEGDEFGYQLGTDAFVQHVPSLLPDRSAKATTHVYAVARLKNGERIPDVMDRAEIEKIQHRGRGSAFSPWATDWDEMGKKTLIKRISKNLPVRPEIRSILVREDELSGDVEAPEAASAPAGPTKVDRLASRLAPAKAAAAPEPAPIEEVEGQASFLEEPPGEVDLATSIRAAAAGSDLDGPAKPKAVTDILATVFPGWDRNLITDGIRVLWGEEAVNHPTAAQVHALDLVGSSLEAEAFRDQWTYLVETAGAPA